MEIHDPDPFGNRATSLRCQPCSNAAVQVMIGNRDELKGNQAASVWKLVLAFLSSSCGLCILLEGLYFSPHVLPYIPLTIRRSSAADCQTPPPP